MANTYSQIHLQLIFAVKFRHGLIQDVWEESLHKYIAGIINNYDHKVLAINGMKDHIHILIGMRPNQSVSELVQFVKTSSTKWINENKLCGGHFLWQEGFGVFAYHKSIVPIVIQYILNQKIHHHKISFNKEYIYILKEMEIEYDERYILKSPD